MKIKLTGNQRRGSLFAALLLAGVTATSVLHANPTPPLTQVTGAVPTYTSEQEVQGTLGGFGTYTEFAFDTATGYDFYIQVNPTTWPGGFLDKVTLFSVPTNYNIYTLGYQTTALSFVNGPAPVSLLGFGTPNSGTNPISADVAGTTVEFTYTPSVAGGVDNGDNSDWLVIDTDASSFTNILSFVGASDGVSVTGAGLAPSGVQVPEAKNVLFGLAIAGVIGVGLLKRKTGLFSSPSSEAFAA